MKRNFLSTCLWVLPLMLFLSCSQSFLDVKPQRSQVILKNLKDVESLMDNSSIMNRIDFYKIISDGDLHFTEAKLLASSELHQNLYIWKKQIDPTGRNNSSWDFPYKQIFYANIAMETLHDMRDKGGDPTIWNVLLGRAQFFRAWAHYCALQDFSPGYDPSIDGQHGIPIILDSSFPKTIHRASVKEVYQTIIEDLEDAAALLPPLSSLNTRPSRQAAYALLSRVYLNMGQWEQAYSYATQALEIDHTLMDYKELNPGSIYSFDDYTFNTHPEIIFYAHSNYPFVAEEGVLVESGLYDSYQEDDTRGDIFFNDKKQFVGTYSGKRDQFTGFATDELFLIQAECLIRQQRVAEGLQVLEELLKHRLKSEVQLSAEGGSTQDALLLVLKERRKELIGRGTHWADLKRLNLDTSTARHLTRSFEGQNHSLPPNDPRYVFAIPEEEIAMSGLEQNIR